jgi:hypothetical protein
MSNNEKIALTQLPLSPDDQYEASELFGKSLFSALQLAKEQELRKKLQERKTYGEDDGDVLKIPIPMNLLPNHQKMAEEGAGYSDPGILARALKTQNYPMRMLAGGQSGFRDAKKEYYMQEKARIHQDLMSAQKEYIDTLSRIKTGAETTETPCVDSFCNGLAYAALFDNEKTALAFDDNVDIEDDSMKRVLHDAASTLKKPFAPVVDTAASGLLGTGTGAAYLTYLLRKKMREKPDSYMDEHMPTRVELQPYA